MTQFQARLQIEMIPQGSWFTNLRAVLTSQEWKSLQKRTFKAANYCCEICNGRGKRHPVECHERWNYDETNNVQTLIGTIALCPACHESVHFGLAELRGRQFEAMQQLKRVNRWDDVSLMAHIADARRAWQRRSMRAWQVDLRPVISWIDLSEKSRQHILAHAPENTSVGNESSLPGPP